MSWLGLLARGLLARRGLTVLIQLVAVLAVAASATGPAYQTAASRSILADDLHGAPAVGTIVDIDGRGPLGDLYVLERLVDRTLPRLPAADLFPTRIRGQELNITPGPGDTGVVAWRDDLCRHLRMIRGRCPTVAGEIVVSSSLASQNHLHLGQEASILGTSRIVGVYEPIDPAGQYWAARSYFPQSGGSGENVGQPKVDAIFTAPASFAKAATLQGDSIIDLLLDLDATTPSRIADVRATVTGLTAAAASIGVSGNTAIPAILDDAASSTGTMTVPVLLVTVQLLILVWLLLFLAVTDAAEARGADVALARLRGLPGGRTLAFGLGETVLLLVLALPVGLLAGWAAMVGLAHLALRDGTPVSIGWPSVVAAVVAVSGGLGAALLGARRTLRRPVLDQWRRPGLSIRRGWVLDVAILVATVAALVELYASGTISGAQADPLALLVPGLVGFAVAVVLSRLLPWACRAVFGLTRRRGRIGAFLAVRQLVRRPAGMRTFIVLSAALSLATFAISAFVVNRANLTDVADTRTGAAAVLTVVPAPNEDLGATVTRLDPGGTQAMAVTDYVDTGNAARQTLAVQTDRLAKIAYWRSDFSPTPLADLAARLHPPAPPPITVTGDTLRVSLAGVSLPGPQQLTANLKLPTGLAETPLTVGTITSRTTSLTVPLPACPCVLRSFDLASTSSAPAANQAQGIGSVHGALTITGLQEHTATGWREVPDAGLSAGDRWSWTGGGGTSGSGTAASTPGGLKLTFDTSPVATVEWSAPAWPVPLPALVTPSVAALPHTPAIMVGGLDGAPLPIAPVAVVPVPGGPDNAVIIDREYALRAAFATQFASQNQVWLAPDAAADFPARLKAAGVTVTSTSTAADADRALRQQGPALALSLFLADAAAAALLAAAGAVTGLYLSGRRRRQELAALLAEGARRGELRASLLLEQGLTLGLGILSGIGSGLLAVWLALRAVPQFVTPPSAPPLHYTPDPVLLGAPLLGIAVIVTVTAVIGALGLVATTRTDLLRQEAA